MTSKDDDSKTVVPQRYRKEVNSSFRAKQMATYRKLVSMEERERRHKRRWNEEKIQTKDDPLEVNEPREDLKKQKVKVDGDRTVIGATACIASASSETGQDKLPQNEIANDESHDTQQASCRVSTKQPHSKQLRSRQKHAELLELSHNPHNDELLEHKVLQRDSQHHRQHQTQHQAQLPAQLHTHRIKPINNPQTPSPKKKVTFKTTL